MKNRIIALLGWLLAVLALQAQTLSVKSFKKLDLDMDARVTAPQRDNNGKLCALIKVVTTEKGFEFDGGMAGVVKVVPKSAEIWVYVPVGLKKISIAHPKLGMLRDYWFPEAVAEATGYELVLLSGKVITTVEEERIQTGFLILETEPEGAVVFLSDVNQEDKLEDTGETTLFQRKLPYGTYHFRLSKPLYHESVGMIEVNAARCEKKIALKPAFGFIEVRTQPVSGAQVEIKGETEQFKTPGKSKALTSGNYTVTVRHEMYAPVTRVVTVTDGETAVVDLALDPRFAVITLETLTGAELYVDGTKRENLDPFELKEGVYDMEVRLPHHRSATKQIVVKGGEPQTLKLEPTPIYGQLDVVSTPIDAEVFLNGTKVGITPLSLDKCLEGSYQMEIRKLGYGTVVKTIAIAENQLTEIQETLPTGKEVTLTAQRTGAKIYVDGEYMGVSSCTIPLGFGSHEVRAEKDPYLGVIDVVVDANSPSNVSIELKEASAMFGSIKLVCEEGTEIYYKEEFHGIGVWNARMLAGTYQVETRKEGCTPAISKVTIRQGKNNSLQLEEPVPIQCKLALDATPKGASFAMNGARGQTPATVELPLGKYMVTFTKSSYYSKTLTVTLEEGKTTELVAQLKPIVYVKPTAFFFGGGLQLGATPYLNAGVVLKNHLLELEYDLPDSHAYEVGWHMGTDYYTASYTLSCMAFRYGYQIALGKKWAVVPQVGVRVYTLVEGAANEKSFEGASRRDLTGVVGARLAWHPLSWLQLYAAPEYGVQVWKGNAFEKVSQAHSDIPYQGLVVRLGLSIGL